MGWPAKSPFPWMELLRINNISWVEPAGGKRFSE
jgi:hypothetical protein